MISKLALEDYRLNRRSKLVADLAKMKVAMTVEESEVVIEDKNGKIMIRKAHMTNTDILCTNAVIHINAHQANH